MPDKKPWWEQQDGESLQDYVKRVGNKINTDREKAGKTAINTLNSIGAAPGKFGNAVVNGAKAYPGIGKNIATATKAGADRMSVKLGNKNFKQSGGSAGGGGGGTTKKESYPKKPNKARPSSGRTGTASTATKVQKSGSLKPNAFPKPLGKVAGPPSPGFRKIVRKPK